MLAAIRGSKAVLGILGNIQDAVLATKLDGRILYSNPAAREMFGYTRKELRGKKVEDLMPERFRDSHVLYREKFAKHGATARMHPPEPVPGLRRDGTEFPIEAMISRYPKFGIMMVSMRDVTLRVEAQLKALRVLQDKHELLRIITHDLRDLFGAIMGNTHVLLAGALGELRAGQKEHLTRIENNARTIIEIIDNFLVDGRSDKMQPAVHEFHLAEAVRSATTHFLPLAAQKGLSCEYAPVDESLTLCADELLMGRILRNLFSNAIKYTEKGGSITISYGRSFAEDKVWVKFIDTGIGIPAEKLEAIFERYVRVDQTAHKGVGLGLPIARDLARQMHGDITVESEVGVGSIFTLTLPKQQRG
jgi:PAS domain S-box-containing protein